MPLGRCPPQSDKLRTPLVIHAVAWKVGMEGGSWHFRRKYLKLSAMWAWTWSGLTLKAPIFTCHHRLPACTDKGALGAAFWLFLLPSGPGSESKVGRRPRAVPLHKLLWDFMKSDSKFHCGDSKS